MRVAIDQFIEEQKRAPENLNDLVSRGYLRWIPRDPFTKSSLTWKAVYGDPDADREDAPAVATPRIAKPKGIIDVHSGSHESAGDGTRYSDW